MLRVLPWIDGVNSVKQIALLADADLKLVRKAIRHLLYYGCVLLLDIFSFGAIYAPTPEITAFVESRDMQLECARYVTLSDAHDSSADKADHKKEEEKDTLTGTQLAELYLSLKQGHSVKAWCTEHAELVVGKIDIRRFITFGVIKGFLYRVHKYAFAATVTTTITTTTTATITSSSNKKSSSSSAKLSRANLYRERQKQKEEQKQKQKHKDKKEQEGGKVDGSGSGNGDDGSEDLQRYLDGTHCFDEICTELMISEKELTARLKAWGDVQIVCR